MTMNSTISELVQDNSNVTPETNPTTTVQKDGLIFGQKHNDIDCALCPTAKRACDRAWVTAKQMENWSEMSKATLWRWLEKLEKARRISPFLDMKKSPILASNGVPHVTTLYNLNVLNQLAMVRIDNEKLNDISCKFSDILSEVETTGSYSINHPQARHRLCLPQYYVSALEALLTEVRKTKALQAEHDETKAPCGASRFDSRDIR